MLVLEAGQVPFDEPEPAAHGDVLRILDAGLVELARDRRSPVEHHRLAGWVGDVAPAHVEPVVVDVQPPEEQRGVGVVGQLDDPFGQVPAESLGGVGVAGHPVTGGEEILGVITHAFEGPTGGGKMLPFGLQVGFECGHVDPLRELGLLARVSGGRPGAWDVRCGVHLTAAVKRTTTIRTEDADLPPNNR